MSLSNQATAAKMLLDLALPQAGLDLRRTRRFIVGVPKFIRQYREFKAKSSLEGLPLPTLGLLYPIIGDDVEEAGEFNAHYLHQDLWAARRVFDYRPSEHFDIGSRLDGFLTSLLVFCPVTMLDVRPFDNPPLGLTFRQADARNLPFSDASIASISTLHAMEHFGMGRYGDAIDPRGTAMGLAEVARVAAPGGRVYVGLPIGRERVMFNAHRVLAPSTVLRMLSPLQIVSFAAVDDDGRFVPDARPDEFEGAAYSCGLFEMTKA